MEVDYYSVIIDYLQKNGPSQPVQLSSVLNKDSFMVSAILLEAIENPKINATKGKIGSSPLYYLPEQEEAAKTRIFNSRGLLEKKFITRVKNSKYVLDSELNTQEKFVIKNCLDFLIPITVKAGNHEARIWRYYTTPEEIIHNRFADPKKEIVKEKSEPPKLSIFKPEQTKVDVEKKDIFSTAEETIRRLNAEVISKSKKSAKEASMVIKTTSGILSQKYYLKINLKKRVSESDLSHAYIEGNEKKLPVIFLAEGKISKTNIEKAKKKFGEFLKIVNI